MKWLRILFRFYIDSSIHVALAICALLILNLLSYDLPVNQWEIIFVFTASVSAYNFAKFAENVGFHHRGLSKYLKSIQFFSLLSTIILIYAAFHVGIKFLEIAGFLALITFLYSLPFLSHRFRLREYKGLKIYIIALVWTGTVLWLPLSEENWWTLDVFLRSISFFFFVLALILPFEIRDLKYDQPELQTIPQKYGVKKTKIFGTILSVLFLGFHWVNISLSLKEKCLATFIGLLVMLLIKKSNLSRSDYYASFWVEAVPIFWLLLFLVF